MQITSTGGVSTTTIAASGGTATTTNANGGNAGSITVDNSVAGNVTTTTLTASTGLATGNGTGGTTTGGISVKNTAGNIQTASISTAGGAKGNGGDVVLDASGTVSTTVGSTITTTGGAAVGSQGTDAGNVTITGSAVTMTLAAANPLITANGGSALTLADARGGHAGTILVTATGGAVNFTNGILSAIGGNAAAGVGAGGNAGSVTITASGDVTANAINARSGNAFTTGVGGAVGPITVSGANVTLGALTTTGGSNGNGGAVTVDATGTLSTGAIVSSGGAALLNTAGRAGGAVSLTAGSTLTTNGAITASGGAGNGAGQAGGAAGNITVSSSGTLNVSAAALTASGGASGTGDANGGNAGAISLTNNSTSTGNLSAGALTAVSGAAAGTGTAAAAGSVTVINNNATAGATLTTAAINVSGGTKGAGGSVILRGLDRTVSGLITASGGAGVATATTGGAAGLVRITGIDNTAATAGTLTTAAITVSTGAASGTGAGGAAGSILLEGTTVSAGALTTTGGANGAGGSITATASLGTLAITGAAAAGGAANAGTAGKSGGNVALQAATGLSTGAVTTAGSAGNGAGQAGGSAGTMTLDTTAGTVTLAGSLTASGGNGIGGAAGGNATQVQLNDAVLLNAAVTVAATGGAGGGASANVGFAGAVDSTGAARALTVNTTAGTTFGGAVGANSALLSLATNAGGTTAINGGSVTTTTTQSYGDAVTLGQNTTLTGTTPTFGSTVNGGVPNNNLALDFSLITAINGANFTNINNLSTGTVGTTQITGTLTTAGSQTFGNAVALTGATVLASSNNQTIALNGIVNGGQTLAVNTSGATIFGGAVGATTPLTSVTTNVGGTTAINGGSVRTTGAQTYNDAVTLGQNATLTSTGNAAIALNGALDGGFGLTVTTTGAKTFGGAVGGTTPLASLATAAGGTTAINGGAVNTIGDQSYGGNVTLGAGTSFASSAGNVTFGGTLNSAVANRLASITAAGSVTFNGAVGAVLPLTSLFAHAQTGNLNLGGNVTVSGAGDSIVLVAGGNFLNPTSRTLAPGAGRWLVYSTDPSLDTRNLTYNFKQYDATYGVTTVAGSGNGVLYTLAPTVTASLGGTATKTYDATLTAPTGSLTLGQSGAVDGDTVNLSISGATYDTRHAGSGKTVTANVNLVGASNGAATVHGYQVTPTAGAAVGTIDPAALTITAQTNTKVYDGDTSSVVTPTVLGLFGADTVTGLAQEYANKNVGTNKTLSVTAYTVNDGNLGGNYTVNTADNATGVITARALTVTAAGVDKVYDGATAATVTLGDNRVAGDVLTSSYTTADFNNKNVGTAKPISVSGIGLAGTDSGNYTFNTTASASADITARALTVSATGVDKVYDGATAATVNLADNRVAGDVLTPSYTTADFNNKNVGTAKPINVSGIGLGGADATNYTFNTTASASADITARALTVTASGVDKVYDGNTAATVTLGDNRVAGDVLTSSYTTADFNNKNVGTAKPISVSGIGLAGTGRHQLHLQLDR